MYSLLIAEDENIERRALRYILEREISNITICGEAKNGLEAIEMSKVSTPDIILMNIDMSEINGLDVQKEILKFLPNVLTIIITSYDDFIFTQAAIRLNVIDYFLKPVKPNDLTEAIKRGIAIIDMQRNRETERTYKYLQGSLIQEAIEFIKKNYNQDIDLETVAAFVHLNPQYFCRYFKNKVGMNFINFLSSCRIKEAKEMLISSDKSITEISMKVGYTDSGYFSKVFFKSVGMTPNKFRAQNQKKLLLSLYQKLIVKEDITSM